jgi:hypothetical protein
MRTSLLLLAFFSVTLFGCTGNSVEPCPRLVCQDDTGVADAGSMLDTGTAIDGATARDAGTTDVDSGTTTVDSGATTVDSGTTTADGGTCVEPGLGDACEDTAGGAPCPTGFECDLGRCLPQGRETCGGFAGAPCHDPVRTECVYESGHGDVGTCFSPAEARCLCATDPTRWPC